MQLITNQLGSRPLPPSSVALGSFDGLHRGHLALIEQMKTAAHSRGLASCVYTFDRHPSFLKSSVPVALLTPLPLKLRLLKEMGIDYVYIEHVTPAYFDLQPEDFVQKILWQSCHAAFVTVGFNYRFGKNRSGTPDCLQKLCRQYAIDCYIQTPVLYDGIPVSSTRVRSLVAQGDLPGANQLLGRPFAVCGLIAHGHQRGRTLLGFPTANLYPSPALQLPPNGVYCTMAEIDGVSYPSVTNVGMVPTFGEKRLSIETHLLSFDGDLYGRQMKVEFLQNIRFEQKFDGADALRRQIEHDKQTALSLFRKENL